MEKVERWGDDVRVWVCVLRTEAEIKLPPSVTSACLAYHVEIGNAPPIGPARPRGWGDREKKD